MRRVERCKKANDVAEPARADATLAWDSGRRAVQGKRRVSAGWVQQASSAKQVQQSETADFHSRYTDAIEFKHAQACPRS